MGKMLLYIILIFFAPTLANRYKDAEIRGSLLFEKDIDRPVIINPTYAVYHRELDLQEIVKATELTQDFTKDYGQFCDNIHKQVISEKHKIKAVSHNWEDKFILTTRQVFLADAPAECQAAGGRLPEIRTLSDLQDLEKFSRKYNISYVHYGAQYDSQKRFFAFFSDGQKMDDHFTTVRYISNSAGALQEGFINSDAMVPIFQASPRTVLYITQRGTFLYLLTQYLKNYRSLLVCEKYVEDRVKTMHDNFLLQITAHLCQRDYTLIKGMTDMITRETKLFTRSPDRDDEMLRDIPQPDKRDIRHFMLNDRVGSRCSNMKCRHLTCEQIQTVHDSIIQHAEIVQKEISYSVPFNIVLRFIVFSALNETKITDFYDFLYLDTANSHVDNDYRHFYYELLCHLEHGLDELDPKMVDKMNPFALFETNTLKFVTHLNGLVQQILYPELFDYGFNFDDDNYPLANYSFHNFKINQSTLDDFNMELQQIESTKYLVDKMDTEYFLSDSGITLQPTAYYEQAPLGWMGGILSKVFGLTTARETAQQYRFILGNTKSIKALDLNQKEIASKYNLLKNELENLHKLALNTEFSISTLIAEFDNKMACRSLQNTIQLSLLKIANALAFALTHRTSPYILSSNELDEIATNSRKNKVFMTNKIEDVETNVIQFEGKLLFTFSIPIIEDDSLFRIYSARAFPIFQTNLVFSADLDVQFFGISSRNLDYIELTAYEYSECLKHSFCKVASPVSTIDDKSHCTVLTYRNNIQSCNMQQIFSRPVRPFFATYGNNTLFSSPDHYQARAICPNLNSKLEPLNEKIELSGIGQLQIKPGCYIVLPDNRQIHSHAQPTIYHLGETTIMEAFRYTPKRYNYTFKITEPNYNVTILPDISLTEVSLNDIETLWRRTWTAQNVFSTTQIFFTIVGIIILILVIMCICSPKFRHFWRAGCPTENPRKYYTKYKNYHLPTFVKMPKVSQSTNDWREKLTLSEIQRQIRKRYTKMTSSERSRRMYEREMLAVHESQQKMVEKMLEIDPIGTDILDPSLMASAPKNSHARPDLYPSVIFHATQRLQNRDLPEPPSDQFTPRSPMTRVRFADPEQSDIIIHNQTYDLNLRNN
ncbi:hypothetical protein [Aeromonas sobria]|uniref:hypothetical protein n=1 Tax=Aeromonas sobria TaxID=646 RepID=UPI003F3509D2